MEHELEQILEAYWEMANNKFENATKIKEDTARTGNMLYWSAYQCAIQDIKQELKELGEF